MVTETERIAILLSLENDAFERKAKSSAKAIDRLEARYDPLARAAKRFEVEQAQLNRSLEKGTIDAARHASLLAKVTAGYDLTKAKLGGATSAVLAMNSATSANTGFLQRNRGIMQQAGYQVGDFAVQVQGGQSALVAFSQQGSQLLGVFGPMGAVMGAVLSVGTILAGTLLSMGSAAGTAKGDAEGLEKAMTSLEGAIASYSKFTEMASASTAELYEQFGKFTVQIQGFSDYMAEISLTETFEALRATIEPLKGELAGLLPLFAQVATAKAYLEGIPADSPEQMLQAREALELYQDALVDAADKMGLLPEQGRALVDALDELGKADGLEAVSRSALDALELIRSFAPAGADLDPALRPAVKALEEMASFAADAAVSADGIAAVDMAGNIASAANEAARLADNFRVALRAAAAVANAQNQLAAMKFEYSPGGQALSKYGGRGGANVTPITDGRGFILKSGEFVDPNAKPTRVGGGGGGGGRKPKGGGGSKADAPFFDIAESELQNLQRKIELMGKTSAETAELTAKHKLLDEAKKRGLELDKVQIGSNMTLREEIDANAASIGALAQQYEAAQEQAKFFEGIQTDVKNGILDGIIEGKNFAGVLGDIAKKFARAALEASLFGTGPFASGNGGGGGVLSGLFGGGKGILSSLFGGKSFDGGGYTGGGARSGGIDGKGGFPAIMHPNETVIDHTRGGAGGPQSSSGVGAVFNIDARGAQAGVADQIAAALRQAAPQIVGQAVNSVKTNWGSLNQQFQIDGSF